MAKQASKSAAKKPAAKKRPSALDKAKAEVSDLKKKLQALNVALDDNIVTHEELKVLKIYKAITFTLLGVGIISLLVYLS